MGGSTYYAQLDTFDEAIEKWQEKILYYEDVLNLSLVYANIEYDNINNKYNLKLRFTK